MDTTTNLNNMLVKKEEASQNFFPILFADEDIQKSFLFSDEDIQEKSSLKGKLTEDPGLLDSQYANDLLFKDDEYLLDEIEGLGVVDPQAVNLSQLYSETPIEMYLDQNVAELVEQQMIVEPKVDSIPLDSRSAIYMSPVCKLSGQQAVKPYRLASLSAMEELPCYVHFGEGEIEQQVDVESPDEQFLSNDHNNMEPESPAGEDKTSIGGKVFKGELCPRDYATSGARGSHAATFDNQTLCLCHICGVILKCKNSLPNHMLRVHSNNQTADSSQDPDTVSNYTCEYCGRSFTRKSSLTVHINCRHLLKGSFPCPLCNKVGHTRAQLKKHQLVDHAEEVYKYKCEHCNEVFKRISHVKMHTSRHHLVKENIACTLCGESVHTRAQLREHELLAHVEVIQYVCEHCNQVLKSKTNLKAHIARLHVGKRDFRCSSCPKKMYSRYELEVHLCYHRKKFLYACPICNRSFATKCNLTAHMKRHGERLHKCEICAKAFFTFSEVKAHLQAHSKEGKNVCDFCGRKYKFRDTLSRHLKKFHKICP